MWDVQCKGMILCIVIWKGEYKQYYGTTTPHSITTRSFSLVATHTSSAQYRYFWVLMDAMVGLVSSSFHFQSSKKKGGNFGQNQKEKASFCLKSSFFHKHKQLRLSWSIGFFMQAQIYVIFAMTCRQSKLRHSRVTMTKPELGKNSPDSTTLLVAWKSAEFVWRWLGVLSIRNYGKALLHRKDLVRDWVAQIKIMDILAGRLVAPKGGVIHHKHHK